MILRNEVCQHLPRRLSSLSIFIVCCGVLFAAPTVFAQQSEPSQWMNEGASALRQGKPMLAEEDFRKALALSPSSADAVLGVGLALLRQGKFDEAASMLAKATELQPEMPGAHMFRGIALFQMNSLDAAAKELRAEIQLQPKSAEALTWLGIIELQAGDPRAAAVSFDKAGELEPENQSVLYYQVRAHTLSAEEAFRALFAIDGDSAYVHRAQGEIYSESQQPEKAIGEYQAAIKKSPMNAELYEALGNEEERISHTAEASSAYQTELTINPNSSIALFNLGKIQVETGDPEQGVALLQRAVDARATAAPTFFYLGLGLAKLGKNQEAVGWLERALASSPSGMIRQRSDYELVRVYQRLDRKADAARALEELKKLKTPAVPDDGQPK